MNLNDLGWNSTFEQNMKEYDNESYSAGRIAKEFKNLYWIYTERGEEKAILSDKLFMSIFSSVELPAVGDWVAFSRKEGFDKLIIEKLLPRKNKFSRKGKNTYGRNFSKAGSSEEQVISANIDIVFLVMSLDRDFNERKLERYLTLICDSGSKPVIILNKADQCENVQEYLARAESVSGAASVHVVSALENKGIDQLLPYIKHGVTATLTGSSGTGKSSIINRIIGENKLYVSHVREDDKRGRHTTTSREMIVLPEGGVIIDNPGMRDIKLSVDEEALDITFSDIAELTTQCRFRNCQHDTEPGCAIKAALEEGSLSYERWENYIKLQREAQHYSARKKQREKFIYNARSQQRVQGIKIKKHRTK